MGRNNGRGTSRRRSTSDGGGGELSAAQILDRFTSVDDLLEETNDTLRDLQNTTRATAELLASLTNQELELPARNDLALVSDAVIEAQDTEEDEVVVPKDGTLSRVLMSFPDGSNQSIGIGIRGVDGENLIPYGPANYNYIALSDQQYDQSLDYPVRKGETLTVRYINNRSTENDIDEDDLIAYPSVVLVITEDR